MPRSTPANRLYFGDCLDIMKEYIPDESITLIYLDPPFNSKRLYNAFIGGAQWVAFDDTWRWHEAIDDFHAVAGGEYELARTMEAFRMMLGEGPELAYLSYMANRLRECHRALTEDGSLYLHCDPTMGHKLKVILDAIFGHKNFRNEIVWCYTGPSNTPRWFPRKHDTIFFYARSDKAVFDRNRVRVPYHPETLARRGRTEGAKSIISPSVKTQDRRTDQEVNAQFGKGKVPENWWADIPILTNQAERIGYPTQKPIALLDRILKASNAPNGFVLDPFCGCGTTIHAAQNLGMPWVGIDICAEACKVIQNRIENHFDSLWGDIEFVGIPKTLDDARTLAEYDKFKFERWAASLSPGMSFNQKQVGDKGIDGWGRYPLRKGVFADVVSQVKGGGTGPGDVQAFNGARLQANADMGVFTCFDERVTNGMRDAAVNAGRFQQWPVLQIYTVEDYFAERKPDLPLAA